LVRPTDKTDRRVKRISVRFLSHLAAVVLGFVIAYFLFPRLLIVPLIRQPDAPCSNGCKRNLPRLRLSLLKIRRGANER